MKWMSWMALVLISVAFAALLEWAGFPAALLLGPIVVAIGFGVGGSGLKIPALGFAAAQAIIGTLVASTVTGPTLHEIGQVWAELLFVIVTTLIASAGASYALTRAKILPGSTAAWGSSPGAAAAMVAMAEDFGADPRLVAFMQYLRVLLVVLSASLVTRYVLHVPTHGLSAAAAASTSPPLWVPPLSLVVTLAIAAASAGFARLIRLPAGVLVGPMIVGGALHAFHIADLVLPVWVLAVAYALLGWYIGLRFTRGALLHALRILPQMLLSTLALIAVCGVSAFALTLVFKTDPLSAFLATSPGGLDSIAIIALGTSANLPFVLAAQTLRLFIVILTGPAIARFISRYA
jgi:membrane AbrB-like protein